MRVLSLRREWYHKKLVVVDNNNNDDDNGDDDNAVEFTRIKTQSLPFQVDIISLRRKNVIIIKSNVIMSDIIMLFHGFIHRNKIKIKHKK